MITEQQYKILCDKLHKILQKDEFGQEIFCVPWMHIIRAHPIVLKRYNEIYFSKKSFSYLFYFIKKNIQIYLNSIQILWKSIFYKSRFYIGEINNRQYDYLFISHLLNNSQINDLNDFYFNDISDHLKSNGLNSIFTYIPQYNYNEKLVKESIKFKDNLLLTISLSFFDEFKIRFSLFKTSRKLLKIRKVDDFDNRILQRIRWEFMSIGSQANMRFIKQIENIILTVQPKYIVVPYEGHGYERLIFSVVNKINPKIICIAYQHTGLFKNSNAIYNFYSKKYNPNMILTSGKHGYDQIKKINKNIPIDILGSFRGLPDNMNLLKSNNNQKCIVVPEGFINECIFLFEFSAKCATEFPNIDFIWRLHPSISFEEIFKKSPNLKNRPSNIILSNNNMDIDIIDCYWALYRGSTAIFKIIANGARPLYLDKYAEISIDPLNDIDDNIRKNISTLNDFINVIEDDLTDILNFSNLYKNIIKNYCEYRFAKLNYEILLPQSIKKIHERY